MNPAYYAIIPANVRYDKRLTANAKLLYGEITALCGKNGYCWARNNYFAELYGVSKITISKWISQLVEYGYLFSEIKYKGETREIEARYLKLNDVPIETCETDEIDSRDTGLIGINEKFNTPINEKFNTPINEKFKDNNNTSINNTSINRESSTPPIKPTTRAKKTAKPTAHKHGEYGWVRLTDEQHKRLVAEYGNETVARVIQYVDELAQQTENKNGWKDWNLVIRRAIRENWGTDKFRHRNNNNVVVDGERKPSYDLDEFERHSVFDSDDWEKIFCGNSKIGSNLP